MRRTHTGVVVAALATLIGISSALAAEGPPPPPKSTNGNAVTLLGTGIPTPTAIAFGRGNIFVAGFGSEDGKTPGGVYVLRGEQAVKVPGLPGAAGLAWKNGTLYATIGQTNGRPQLVAWSGWTGSAFTKKRVVWSGPKRFSGFNGLAIGWNGRIYAGVGLSDDGDTKKSNRPYAQSVISMRVDGSDVKTVATGMRQPWQLAFVKGVARPYVTVLGQENLGKNQPPDWIVVARDGDDFGFPTCNWSKPKACSEFAKPVALLPAHSSPTGIAAMGSTLYVALFNGTGRGPAVVTMPSRGGTPKPFLTGFAAPVVAVGVSGGYVYVGDLTGSVYRVRA
jgi:glucose/arabinose dehydrogenase